MCGIFGATGSDLARVDVASALSRIAHRGPDGEGIWRSEGVVLGHRRLAVIDLSPLGAQPMLHEASGCALTFNGEIYNHRSLRGELESRGHVFQSRSDTEVILLGYLEWGTDIVEKLEGMFAFGIWDPRVHTLLLATDRCGEKPLFYAPREGGLAFASEIKALVASGVEERVDVGALPMLLSYGYVPEASTLYHAIRRLPPASILVAERGRAPRVRGYYRPSFTLPAIESPRAAMRQDLRRLVERSVEMRLESDVPLGAFLSGGVDSSIIVGVMSRVLGRKVKTFSIGFRGDARFDETHYARLVARAFDTDHTEFALEPASFDLVERLVDFHDGPFGDSSAIPTSVVAMLAREHVTVAMSGDGGDELFCGYSRFLAAEGAERVPRSLRALLASVASLRAYGPNDRHLLARGARFLANSARPLAERLVRWSSYFTFELREAIRPELARTLDLDAPLAWADRILSSTEGTPALGRILDHNFRTYLPYDLLVKSDRCAMAHSLEVRSPFLDTSLIEYAASLPDSTRRRGTDTKTLLKETFADMLPREILHRPKMGFGMPLGTWFRGELRPYLESRLGRGARLYEWLDEAYVARHLREHFSGTADHGHRLWLLLTLEVWLQQLASRGTVRA